MAGWLKLGLQGVRNGVRRPVCGSGLSEGALRLRISGGCESGAEKAGLYNPVEHDTDAAVRCGVEALRILICRDREKRKE